MGKSTKRILSLVLCAVMLTGMLPVTALAEGEPIQTEETTPAPTQEPTAAPTEAPTAAPTEEPTAAPTEEPTVAPTEEPTTAPTEEPTAAPTEAPTAAPAEPPVVSVQSTPQEKVAVVFHLAPEDAELVVYSKDEQGNKEEIKPETDGSYMLVPGRYYYALTAEGFETVEEKEFEISASEKPVELTVTMTELPAGSAEPEVTPEPSESPEPSETPEPSESPDPSESPRPKHRGVAKGTTSGNPSGTCGANGDNLTWELVGGTLTISGTGTMNDFQGYDEDHDLEWQPAAWYDYKDDITSIIVGEGVTSIGVYAFCGLTNVSSVSLPSTLTKISGSAFSGCSALPSITLSSGLTVIGIYAFSGCTSLTSVEIPSGWTRISGGVFKNCTGLTSVTIPQSVTRIESEAFQGCTALERVNITDLVSWCGITFVDTYGNAGLGENPLSQGNAVLYVNGQPMTELTIPSSVSSISNFAFYGYKALTSVSIPASVNSVGQRAFCMCSNLSSVTVGAKTVSQGAFENCSSLNSVTLSEGVETLGKDVFSYDQALSAITIPSTLISIGSNAFENCINLTRVNVANLSSWCGITFSLGEWGEPAAGQCRSNPLSNACLYMNGEKVTSLVLPSDIDEVASYTFYCMKDLESLTIGENIQRIGACAFANISELQSITFEGNLPVIAGFSDGGSAGSTYYSGASFIRVVANAYYPANNETFTEDTKQNYGGTLTWIPVCSEHEIVVDEAVAPTCTETGLTEGSHCSVCGEVIVAQTEIPAAGHTPSGIRQNAHEATATEPGYTGDLYCSVCGELIEAGEVIPAGLTGRCGDNVIWRLVGNTLTISGTGPMYDNYTGQFCGNEFDSIETVIIESGVTYIGGGVFFNCSAETVTIQDGIDSIGAGAFNTCQNLTSVSMPDSIVSIGAGAFTGCSNLISIELPSGVTSVGPECFSGCSGMTAITIPESVTSIGGCAFELCGDLSEIIFQGQAPEIGANCFSGVTATAYYPANDASWTEDVRQNYGGTITWVAEGSTGGSYDITGTFGTNVAYYWDPDTGELVIFREDPDLPASFMRSQWAKEFRSSNNIYGLVKTVCFANFVSLTGEGALNSGNDLFGQWSNLESADLNRLVVESGNLKQLFYNCRKLTTVSFAGCDTSSVTDISSMFQFCGELLTVDLQGLDTTAVLNMSGMFSDCSKLSTLDLSGLDTSEVTNMSRMLSGCRSLTTLVFSGLDTSKVTNMNSMFSGCSSLTTLDLTGFVTSSATNMGSMFSDCQSLTTLDISGFNTAAVTDMSSMFSGCRGLTSLNLSSFSTSNVTEMSYMFNRCRSLTTLNVSNFNTANVTSMRRMFAECDSLTSLNLAGFDTRNVTDMEGMFYASYRLTQLDLSGFQTPAVTNMKQMFYNCASLVSLDLSGIGGNLPADLTGMFSSCTNLVNLTLPETEHVLCASNMDNMFAECKSLVSVDLRCFNTEAVTSMYQMFKNCTMLASLDLHYFATPCVTTMREMFSYCSGLNSVVFGEWSNNALTNMNSMFSYCYSLTSVDMSGFNTEHVVDMSALFFNCKALLSADLSSFYTASATNIGQMFSGCTSLTEVNIEHFNTGNVTLIFDMFKGTALQSIVLGPEFSFKGNGSATPAVLPDPTVEKGRWQLEGNTDVNGEYTSAQMRDNDPQIEAPGHYVAAASHVENDPQNDIIWDGTVEGGLTLPEMTIQGGTDLDPVVCTVRGTVKVEGTLKINSGYVEIVGGTDDAALIYEGYNNSFQLVRVESGANHLKVSEIAIRSTYQSGNPEGIAITNQYAGKMDIDHVVIDGFNTGLSGYGTITDSVIQYCYLGGSMRTASFIRCTIQNCTRGVYGNNTLQVVDSTITECDSAIEGNKVYLSGTTTLSENTASLSLSQNTFCYLSGNVSIDDDEPINLGDWHIIIDGPLADGVVIPLKGATTEDQAIVASSRPVYSQQGFLLTERDLAHFMYIKGDSEPGECSLRLESRTDNNGNLVSEIILENSVENNDQWWREDSDVEYSITGRDDENDPLIIHVVGTIHVSEPIMVTTGYVEFVGEPAEGESPTTGEDPLPRTNAALVYTGTLNAYTYGSLIQGSRVVLSDLTLRCGEGGRITAASMSGFCSLYHVKIEGFYTGVYGGEIHYSTITACTTGVSGSASVSDSRIYDCDTAISSNQNSYIRAERCEIYNCTAIFAGNSYILKDIDAHDVTSIGTGGLMISGKIRLDCETPLDLSVGSISVQNALTEGSYIPVCNAGSDFVVATSRKEDSGDQAGYLITDQDMAYCAYVPNDNDYLRGDTFTLVRFEERELGDLNWHTNSNILVEIGNQTTDLWWREDSDVISSLIGGESADDPLTVHVAGTIHISEPIVVTSGYVEFVGEPAEGETLLTGEDPLPRTSATLIYTGNTGSIALVSSGSGNNVTLRDLTLQNASDKPSVRAVLNYSLLDHVKITGFSSGAHSLGSSQILFSTITDCTTGVSGSYKLYDSEIYNCVTACDYTYSRLARCSIHDCGTALSRSGDWNYLYLTDIDIHDVTSACTGGPTWYYISGKIYIDAIIPLTGLTLTVEGPLSGGSYISVCDSEGNHRVATSRYNLSTESGYVLTDQDAGYFHYVPSTSENAGNGQYGKIYRTVTEKDYKPTEFTTHQVRDGDLYVQVSYKMYLPEDQSGFVIEPIGHEDENGNQTELDDEHSHVQTEEDPNTGEEHKFFLVDDTGYVWFSFTLAPGYQMSDLFAILINNQPISNADWTTTNPFAPTPTRGLRSAQKAEAIETPEIFFRVSADDTLNLSVIGLEYTEPYDETLKFTAASLELRDSIAMNFKAPSDLFENGEYHDPYAVFQINEYEYTIDTYKIKDGKYVFLFDKIPPQCMKDIVTATLYAKNADNVVTKGKTITYSVYNYCDSQLKKQTEQTKLSTLLVDILNYGARSQIYMGHNTNDLVNASLTTEQQSWGTTGVPTYTTVQNVAYGTVENPEAAWKAVGLTLNEKVIIRYKVEVQDLTGLEARITCENGSEWTIAADEFEALGSNQYYIRFNGLYANHMRKSVDITLYRNGTAVSNTLRYSVESYVYSQMNKPDNVASPELKALLLAMLTYGDTAIAYQ